LNFLGLTLVLFLSLCLAHLLLFKGGLSFGELFVFSFDFCHFSLLAFESGVHFIVVCFDVGFELFVLLKAVLVELLVKFGVGGVLLFGFGLVSHLSANYL